jgi:hypothetical protein
VLTWVGSCLTYNYQARLKRLKHSSWLYLFVSNKEKKFYNIEPRTTSILKVSVADERRHHRRLLRRVERHRRYTQEPRRRLERR